MNDQKEDTTEFEVWTRGEGLKIILRALISIVVGIPTLWILYLTFTCMGLFLIVPVVGFFGVPFNWLIGDKGSDEREYTYVKNGRVPIGFAFYVLVLIYYWEEPNYGDD